MFGALSIGGDSGLTNAKTLWENVRIFVTYRVVHDIIAWYAGQILEMPHIIYFCLQWSWQVHFYEYPDAP